MARTDWDANSIQWIPVSNTAPTNWQVYTYNSSNVEREPWDVWGWDMSTSTYDPTSVAWDAFDMDNMVQWDTNKFVTATDITNLGNLSWTNTGDEIVATWAEVNTGTDNNKMVTPKAISDSKLSYTDGTETLTNKRVTPRISTETSSATPTINTDNVDAHSITAQAADITSFTTNLSWTPTNFQKLIIRIKDDGTARAITWWASFEAKWVALPTTTVISKVLTVWFIYDTVTSKWGCVASTQEE